MTRAVLCVVLIFSACPVLAQELSLSGGAIGTTGTPGQSLTVQLEYAENLGEHAAWSLSYLNEGHFPDHHRDGCSGQLWARTRVAGEKLALSVGIGPYYYFDTTRPAWQIDGYTDNHGWGAIGSLAATWYTESRWLMLVRSNWIRTDRSIDTFSVSIGIGYQLVPARYGEPVPQARERDDGNTTRNELTVFLGRAIVNSFGSEYSLAESVEYRRSLGPNIDWTVSWLDEGDNIKVIRNGITTELWLVGAFFDDRLALGAGAGIYRATDLDVKERKQDNDLVSEIVSMTGSYRFDPRWGARVIFHRIVTNYSRDADVILGGIGYRF